MWDTWKIISKNVTLAILFVITSRSHLMRQYIQESERIPTDSEICFCLAHIRDCVYKSSGLIILCYKSRFPKGRPADPPSQSFLMPPWLVRPSRSLCSYQPLYAFQRKNPKERGNPDPHLLIQLLLFSTIYDISAGPGVSFFSFLPFEKTKINSQFIFLLF